MAKAGKAIEKIYSPGISCYKQPIKFKIVHVPGDVTYAHFGKFLFNVQFFTVFLKRLF